MWYSFLSRHRRDVLCLFFFSSRRRHTRSKRDWSSDVCSSDLARTLSGEFGQDHQARRFAHVVGRSEERRVGKECRFGCSTEQQKKKTRASARTFFTFRHYITPSARNF